MNILGQQTKSEPISNRTIQVLQANVRLEMAGGAVLSQPDFTKVNVTATLFRQGERYELFSDTLQALALESMYFASISFLRPASCVITATSPYTFLFPLHIDLGLPINLTGDDEIVLDVASQTGWQGPNPSFYNATNSNIELVWRETIGVESVIPQIKSIYMDSANFKRDLSLGDNITSIGLINMENLGTGWTVDSANRWTLLRINSDKYFVDDTHDEMVCRRGRLFDSDTEAQMRQESFIYKPEGEIDNVNLRVQLNPANIQNGKNCVMFRTFIMDAFTWNRSEQLERKHQKRDDAKARRHMKLKADAPL